MRKVDNGGKNGENVDPLTLLLPVDRLNGDRLQRQRSAQNTPFDIRH